jgi:hypothetical protein
VRTTTQAASPAAPIVLAGDWLVYFASENFSGPAGTNLNDNGFDVDTVDQVAFAVDLRARTETNLGVAALGAVIVGSDVYVLVDESADGRDWNGGGLGDVVLVHWSSAAGAVTLVDTLDLAFPEELPLAAGSRLYYTAAVAALGPDETSLRYLERAAPTTPVTVLNEAGAGAVEAHLFDVQLELLFATLDEADDGLDRNGDLDAADAEVLALLDGTDPAARLKNVALALPPRAEGEPVAARLLAPGDWRVAFLVDESAQGNVNLNDQALFSQPLLPDNCLATPDVDTDDQVLHYLDSAAFLAGAAQPVNTGLAGHGRVLVLAGFVATIADEDESNCNLNAGTGDTDTSDEVARWVATALPITPARDAEDLHALAAVPGGSRGLAVLDERLVAVIDEAADGANHDGKAADHELVAWLDPAAANPTWRFAHQSASNPSFGTGVFDDDGDSEPFAGTSWMAAEAVGDRLPLVFLEEVPGTNPDVGSLNTNLDCNLVVKDTDKTDGLPVWADFEAGPTLDFDGMGYAVDLANAGLEIAGAHAFFRVSESADARDYNGDGQTNDLVLFRNPLTTCGPVPMATSSAIVGPVVTTDRASAAAFLSSESQAGVDFNQDGDTGDVVVRYFRF